MLYESGRGWVDSMDSTCILPEELNINHFVCKKCRDKALIIGCKSVYLRMT